MERRDGRRRRRGALSRGERERDGAARFLAIIIAEKGAPVTSAP